MVLFAALLYRIRGDLATALHRLSPAGIPWIVAAIVAECLSFLCYAGVQRRLLSAGGARLKRRTVVELTVAATGITNLVPGGTAPASGWLVGQYRRHGVPLPLALWAVLVNGFTSGISVLFVLLWGAAVAALISPWLFVGLLALLVAAAVAGAALAHHLPTVREWLAKERKLPAIGVARRVVHHAGTVAQFRATLPGGTVVYALSVANWLLDVIVLATGFLVLNLPVPWRALLFAYAAGQVAGSLAPLPGGIGFVEGGMIGALTLAGTPAGAAVVATIVYRLITTLGMAGIGSGALFVVHHREPEPAVLHGEAAALARRGQADGKLEIPSALAAAAKEEGRADWLATLPDWVAVVEEEWSVRVGKPFQPGGHTAWVAPAARDGGDFVVKVLWRHDESEHEAEGLRAWAGNGAVLVHEACDLDDRSAALLLERCCPGEALSRRPAEDQDLVVAGLLRRLWIEPPPGHRFRSLASMCRRWTDEHAEKLATGSVATDAGLSRTAMALFEELPRTSDCDVLLFTDLHAGNVLSAQREPWLAIDPKPYVGDPAYDLTQHLLNCDGRLEADPHGLARRMAELAGCDSERVALWLFARCVYESADVPALADVARRLAPR